MINSQFKRRLIDQGYDEQEVSGNTNIIFLSRWTPFACAVFGITGLILKSPLYFLILGGLTFIGPFRPWSFYDYMYIYFFSPILHQGPMPKHKIYRKTGCAIGALIYITSSVGFYVHNIYLAFIPASFIICIAILAGIFGWCFVSAVHHFILKVF